MPATTSVTDLAGDYLHQVTSRIERLAANAQSGAFDAAIDLMVTAINAGGVIQAFGTGHSEAFAMEIAGRAGGLIPTNKIALRDVVLYGSKEVDLLGGSSLERSPAIVDELFDVTPVGPDDLFMIASNSGVNSSIVGLALLAKARGHQLIAVTSMEHTMRVEPKHASGKRLCDVADVVLDNLAPYGDSTLQLGSAISAGISVGAVSSITAAFIAQLLTIGTADRIASTGTLPPMYISANIPGGDEHNHALEDLYRDKIRRSA
ncbi:MAG: sugar isomerase domain-containing protein [Nakamurella sp.]